MTIFTKRNAIVGWFALKLWKRKAAKAAEAVPVPSARTGGAAAAGTAAALGGILLILRRKRGGEEGGEP